MFDPDSPLVARIAASPNREARREGFQPNLLILHYTGMASAEAAIQWLASPASRVSCHYVIDGAGAITQMVPEELRAWHAGVSHWRGVDDINSCSIGIEIHNPGHDGGYPDFPVGQMASVAALCLEITRRHAIKPHRVLAHSDVAPRRKKDPGEKFDWATLARAGVGHWIEAAQPSKGEALAPGSRGNAVMRWQRQLRAYGYWVDATGEFDNHTGLVTAAFQRHFRQALTDGRADRSTVETLDGLLASLPE